MPGGATLGGREAGGGGAGNEWLIGNDWAGWQGSGWARS
jgi:hypothetical protein